MIFHLLPFANQGANTKTCKFYPGSSNFVKKKIAEFNSEGWRAEAMWLLLTQNSWFSIHSLAWKTLLYRSLPEVKTQHA